MSAFCRLTGCTRPLQQAAMSRVTTPALTAAVSEAGALGMLAVGRAEAGEVASLVAAVRARTQRPFGAGCIVSFLRPGVLDALSREVRVIECFYGWPESALVPAGAIVGWQVGSADEARAAVDAGCAFVIAQGVEAGGHVRGTEPLASLLPAVRAAVDVPLVAAGGLGTAADVRAAMSEGADAVRIGTRFLAAAEADVHPDYLSLLMAAHGDDTLLSEVFSVGWPDAPHRVLASAASAALAPGPDPVGMLAGMRLPRCGTTPPVRATTGQIEAMALYAGRSVTAVHGVAAAAAIIDELLEGLP